MKIKPIEEWGWFYGLIKVKTKTSQYKDPEYELHEIYPDDKGGFMWTQDPISFYGESPEDVIQGLEWAIRDIKAGCVFEVKGKKLKKLE